MAKENEMINIKPILLGMLILVLFFLIVTLPAWLICRLLSDKIQYYHILIFFLLCFLGSVAFHLSTLFEMKKKLFIFVGYFIGVTTFVLLVIYIYRLFL